MIDKSLRKFVIISVILFLSVLIIGLYIIINKPVCNSLGNCEMLSGQFIQLLIIMIGAIGMTYALMIIKQFDSKMDKEIIDNYKKLLDYNKEDKKDNKKILSF